ncbi:MULTISPECIES: hypothetical protein [Streptomyces]|uniref:Uncharacterized protein n=1 Tax=Streptomyces himastatinicus ATCC 53653 TaxID=457427 RepID=D9WSQ0_9ACTN|nr:MULTISPECIES: hypothetical protein [Streptomyces]EFL24175.1 conserved hypothetical protein [Streptomyces himastatinicus ATCC 53653]
MAFFIPLIIMAIGLALWNRIMVWAREQLFPWVAEHLPWMTETVKLAFTALDKYATAARRNVKAAWKQLRSYLLEQVIEFEKGVAPNTYVRRMTALMKNHLSGDAPVKRIVVEEDVAWDDLPEKYRKSLVAGDGGSYRMDVTRMRDQELEE